MKYCMKSLLHNGIYVPQFEYNGFSVKIQGQAIKLSPATEQMAVFWVRKRLSPTSPPDKVFYQNFAQDFLSALRVENTSMTFLETFQNEHLAGLNAAENEWMTDEGR